MGPDKPVTGRPGAGPARAEVAQPHGDFQGARERASDACRTSCFSHEMTRWQMSSFGD